MNSRFLITTTATLLLAASSAFSQSGPVIPGVSGGVFQHPLGSQIKYVNFYGIILPVNGLKNYVFYYAPFTANKFLGQSTSPIRYLRADFTEVAEGPTVTYNPDSSYLTGVTVPPNPSDPYGVNGNAFQFVGGSAPGITGFIRRTDGSPVTGTSVKLFRLQNGSWSQVDELRTNGAGFYTFYYVDVTPPSGVYGFVKGFLQTGTYQVVVCGKTVGTSYTQNSNNTTAAEVSIVVQPLETGFCLN